MSIVKLENIAVRFGMKTVFDRFNLVVDVGEFLCIMGESGSGKSTLLNVIGLLEKPTSGRVSLFGISGVSPGGATANKLRREKIGFLFQNYGLIDNEDIDYNLGQHRTIAEASAVESPIRQETIGFPAHFFARAHNFKPPGRACQPEADSPMRT